MATAKPTTKKKKKKFIPRLLKGRGQAHIKSTYNNTVVTITDMNGNTICWGTSGKYGFKSAKKSTPYAAGVVVKEISPAAKEAGVKEVDVLVRGVGPAREAAVRALSANGIQIVGIKDVTPVPHNGCRPKKPRRV
jgi:small subunit ribosomal protein S11